MKKIISTLLFGFMLVYTAAQSSSYFPNYQGYYYAGGIAHTWTNDSTSANIIIKNMHNFNAIVVNLMVLFTDSTDEILADSAEDDNIIINSLSLPLYNKDSLIALIQIEADDIGFFTYSKIVDNEPIWLRNEVLVKYKDSTIMTLTSLQTLLTNYDLISITQELDNEYSILCKNEYDLMTIANMLYDTNIVKYSTPDFYSKSHLNTTDPYYSAQWGLKNTGQQEGTPSVDIKAEQAWAFLNAAIGSKGTRIKVAIIDDGVEEHDDFYEDNGYSRLLDGYTANGYGTGRPATYNRHGQCCAGIIAAGHNDIAVAGIAPNSLIVPIRIIKERNPYFMEIVPFFSNNRIAKSITKAWKEYKADILSNSWGGGSSNDKINDAITQALQDGRNGKGCIVVFSAGNANTSPIIYPANANSDIIAVGAIDRCGIRSGRLDKIPNSCDPWSDDGSPGSSYGEKLDIVAPGTNIPTLDRMNNYGYNNTNYYSEFGGTSAACPHIAGVAALMLSANPGLTQKEIANIIESTAQKVGGYNYQTTSGRPNGTWNQEVGYGLVNAHKAVVYAYMDGRTMEISSRSHTSELNTCNSYFFDLLIDYARYFTFSWSCSDNLVIQSIEAGDRTIRVSPVSGGNGTIRVNIYSQGELMFTIKKEIHINGDFSTSLTPVSNTPLSITGNTTWTGNNNLMITSTTIEAGATLTIQGDVYCKRWSSFIVKPGGKLIVDGGRLTSACDGELWDGITVLGYPDKTQTSQNQGTVQLKNGATIENANTGIYVGPSSTLYQLDGYGSGGIINADDAHFINNRRSVYFDPYVGMHHILWYPVDNRSYFSHCEFLIDNRATQLFTYKGSQVELQEVKKITFTHCRFRNEQNVSSPIDRISTKGIYANQSGLQIGADVFSPIMRIDNVIDEGRCEFSGFGKAIHIVNSNNPTYISFSQFYDNDVAIDAELATDLKVGGCHFQVPPFVTYPIPSAISLDRSAKYVIENNLFYGERTNIGIQVNNSGTGTNSIRSNTFENFCTACLATGENGGTLVGDAGLVFTCNSYRNNEKDISIEGENSTIRAVQSGASYSATGNTFANSSYNLYSSSKNVHNYYFYLSDVNHKPTFSIPNISITSCLNNFCSYTGYIGNDYYNIRFYDRSVIAINDDYVKMSPLYASAIDEYNDRGFASQPVNWEDMESHQVRLYYEITELKNRMDNLCYEALDVISVGEYDNSIELYRTWIDRINTVESNYQLVESYIETREFERADHILAEMPEKFKNIDREEYEDIRRYYNIVREYSPMEGDHHEMPPHLAEQLISLSSRDNYAGIKSFSLGELTVPNWNERVPERPFVCIYAGCECPFIDYYSTYHKNASSDGNSEMSEKDNRLETSQLQQIDVYPNPANNTLFVKLTKQPETSIQYNLYDIQGKQLVNGNFSEQKYGIDISHISKGIYFIAFTIENQTRIVKKVIKE